MCIFLSSAAGLLLGVLFLSATCELLEQQSIGAMIGAAATAMARDLKTFRESVDADAYSEKSSFKSRPPWKASSFLELSVEALFRLVNLAEEYEELESELSNLEDLCTRQQRKTDWSKAEWSECFQAKREVSTMIRQLRLQLWEAANEIKYYTSKHNEWNPGNQL
ncbi:unknown protein [Seminavis robusta]|uniref:Uncharacterized protein n=1 Tax=Seminavis robusta TaxID=568900 RepID=A0A9N8HXL6_9STRA|nr:unknown protein [Seminavis robusta]|eukprot:Sro2503_g329560.1 n/a (165) ;mRNA; f:1335-1829